MSTISARAFKDTDKSWTIEIPELTSSTPGGAEICATGSASTFRGVDKAARELAAAWLDVDVSEVVVSVAVDAPAAIVQLVNEAAEAEATARAASAHGAKLRREAAKALHEASYTAEAAAAVLGVSQQRVQQLLTS